MFSYFVNVYNDNPQSISPISDVGASNGSINEGRLSRSSSSSLNALCGWTEGHHFFHKSTVPLMSLQQLGSGSLGVVDEVRVPKINNGMTMARKQIQVLKSNRRKIIGCINDEIATLKSLQHLHIVQFLGSYEEELSNRSLAAILMYPVGDADLKTFLDNVGPCFNSTQTHIGPSGTVAEASWLTKWFTCLLSALSYMHEQGIRHQDIKPSNIIHRGSEVFFTDFSSAAHFVPGHTTSSDSFARSTAMYTAPEQDRDLLIDEEIGRHGRSADVFSLGCVFIEMLVVLRCHAVVQLHDLLLAEFMVKLPLRYSRCLEELDETFLNVPEGKHVASYVRLLYEEFVKPMLASDRTQRPEAKSTLQGMDEWLRSWNHFDYWCPCRSL